MPALLDMLFAVLLVVVASLVEHFFFWPRFRAETEAGVPGARVRGYRRGVIGQWAFVALFATLWTHYARPFDVIRLGIPTGWRLIVSGVLVALMIALVCYQIVSVSRLTPARRIAARPKVAAVAFLLPHTRSELRWFLLLSATAGFCEELLYRGYLVWFFSAWLGTAGAYLAVIVLFGIGHSYQGRKGAIRATLAGAVMTAFVALTGWLIPVMIIHALVDAGSGMVGYWLLRDDDAERASAAPLQSVQPLAG